MQYYILFNRKSYTNNVNSEKGWRGRSVPLSGNHIYRQVKKVHYYQKKAFKRNVKNKMSLCYS